MPGRPQIMPRSKVRESFEITPENKAFLEHCVQTQGRSKRWLFNVSLEKLFAEIISDDERRDVLYLLAAQGDEE